MPRAPTAAGWALALASLLGGCTTNEPSPGEPAAKPLPPRVKATRNAAPYRPQAADERYDTDSRSSTCWRGDCTVHCAPGDQCDATCSGGDCSQSCDANARCDFTCSGGGCTQVCKPGSSCHLTCSGGGCKRECAPGASCADTCTGGRCGQRTAATATKR